jgi:Flp pilus assembly protein TadD
MMAEEADPGGRSSSELPRTRSGRPWGLALVLIIFVVYPAVRWMVFGGGGQSAATTAPVTPEGDKTQGVLSPIPEEKSDALLGESMQHYQAKRFADCLVTALKAAELNPGSARAFNNAGICAGALQLWDEALRQTQQALRLDPNFQLAKNNLAWIQQEKSKAEAAEGK